MLAASVAAVAIRGRHYTTRLRRFRGLSHGRNACRSFGRSRWTLLGTLLGFSGAGCPHPVQNLIPGSGLVPQDVQNGVAEDIAGAAAAEIEAVLAVKGVAAAGAASTGGAGWFAS